MSDRPSKPLGVDVLGIIETYRGRARVFLLEALEREGFTEVSKLPFTVRILLENMLRNYDGRVVTDEDVAAVAEWPKKVGREIPFMPGRVIMQDYTGVPAIVDLAAMRDAVKEAGGDPSKANPLIPVDLIIDHSVAVDYFGTFDALSLNMELEMKRYSERYRLFKWAQQAFMNLRVFPPGKGIIHQLNLEYIARVVDLREVNGLLTAFPDTVLGMDSHTTMINGISVLGWGVGGIEAEAVMLGQPYYLPIPEVVGVRLEGELPEGATPTDLVLSVTEFLRRQNVVGKFVEFVGPGVKGLTAPDRATVANMAPEYGSTTGFFPIDEVTISFLLNTARPPEHVKLVERYAKMQNLFYTGGETPSYTKLLVFDMGNVEPSIAGPSHPEDRIPLKEAKAVIERLIKEWLRKRGRGVGLRSLEIEVHGEKSIVGDGSIVIAAITSCTNTSNPTVMIGAGLLAKKAVERGLRVKPHVKTSLGPGSRVVVGYLKRAGLLPYLEALRFHVTGFGCTVCIGNSGRLPRPVEEAVVKNDFYVASVLSGNRNFAGRVHPLTRGNFLASPILVVAYALAGRINIDFEKEPIGYDPNGRPVFLRDIWPSAEEIKAALDMAMDPELYKAKYSDVLEGGEGWRRLEAPSGLTFQWDPESTFIRRVPFFEGLKLNPPQPGDIKGARVLLLLGDRISTDHISPAGAIPVDSPAGRYLMERGVKPEMFGTYGARRGNHEVMMRGTFFHPRLRNYLVDREGGYTVYFPTGEVLPVYEAAMRYMRDGTPLIVIAGKQYGVGSSRDWAAKGPALLGVRAVIAEGFERIHRSNLVGMGILPLQFMEGEGWRTLGLTGREIYDIEGISEGLSPKKILRVTARREDGSKVEFKVVARLDTWMDVKYYLHGGILRYVLRKMLTGEG